MTTLLLVGDRLAQDEELVHLARREGFETATVATAAEALERVAIETPWVILIEHRLPDADGVELLKTARERHPGAEAVLVTAGGEMESAIEVLRAGALDYLRYPIDLQELRVALGRARERRLQNPASSPPVILVIEDHQSSRERLVKILEKEGYRVHAAADGVEAMELFHQTRVDLLILDLSMPRMGGLEVLAKTKGAGADVEVLVMTGYGDELTVVQALRDGAINFLRKPIDIDQLLVAIDKALEFQITRRSLLYRNRDVELMRQLVVRLTLELELIVETHGGSQDAVGFLHQFVDALPIGVIVADSRRRIAYANRHVQNTIGGEERLTADRLRRLGIKELSDERLSEIFDKAVDSNPGTIQTEMNSADSYFVLISLEVVSQITAQRYVGIVTHGSQPVDPV